MARPKQDPLSRFWSKVDRRGPDECWPWTAGTDPYGYGKFKCDGRDVGAHRYAYEAENGPVPPGLVVRQRCGNLLCCSLGHMAPGPKETDRPTRPPGRNKGDSKLTPRQILAIRESGERIVDLAKRYGVPKGTICDIRSGRPRGLIQRRRCIDVVSRTSRRKNALPHPP